MDNGMDTKSQYSQRASQFLLPTETWHAILDYATYLRGEFGVAEWTGEYDVLELGRLDISTSQLGHLCSERDLREQLQTRLNLSLVSRRWQKLMLTNQYKTIFIRKLNHLQELIRLFQESPSLGLATQRVHLAMGFLLQASADEHTSLIPQLLGLCPNMAVHSGVHISFKVFPILSAALSKRVGHRLQYIHCANGAGFFDQHAQISTRLSMFQHLRALVLPFSLPTPPPKTPPICLSKLEILDFGKQSQVTASLSNHIASWKLPKLHTVHLRLFSYSPPALNSFWTAHGRSIRTLNVTDSRRSLFISAPLRLPQSIASDLSNLRQLVINSAMDSTMYMELSRIASVERLEIRFNKSGVVSTLEEFHVPSADPGREFPALNCVRFSGLPEQEKRDGSTLSQMNWYLSRFSLGNDIGVDTMIVNVSS